MAYLLTDVKQALRRLVKHWGFTLVVVLSLGIGIGANTTIFSLIDAVFLQTLPVEEPQRLVALYGVRDTDMGRDGMFNGFIPISYPNFEDLRDQNDVLSGLTTWHGIYLGLAGDGRPEQILGEFVSGDFFEVLGLKPARGRFFTLEEDQAEGAHPVAVISHGLWTRRYGADPSVVGSTLQVNGQSLTVVGIGPPGFKGTHRTFNMEMWIPNAMFKQISRPALVRLFDSRAGRMFFAIGRLKDGVDFEAAAAAIHALGQQLKEQYPEQNKDRSVILMPLEQALINPGQRDTYTKAGGLLAVVVGILLLIACVNVANLLVVRSMARSKEIAIRLALGAPRGRLVSQLLTEALTLFLLGALVAIPIALVSLRLLWRFKGQYFDDGSLDLSLDLRVLGFTLLVALVTGVVFGLIPALRASRPDVVGELKEQTAQPTVLPRRFRGGHLLIALQVAFAVVALVAAGLFLRSLQNARSVDLGYNTANLGVLTFNPGTQGYDEATTRQLYQRVLEQTRALPGVVSATLAEVRPMNVTFYRFVKAEGQTDDEKIRILSNIVALDYFRTLQMPLAQGRPFDTTDREDSVPVAVVNQTMARTLWPDREAVGQRFLIGTEETPIQVVGVVEDARYLSVGEEPRPYFYLPLEQRFTSGVTLHVRTGGDPGPVLRRLQQEMEAIDPNLPVIQIQTVEEILRDSLWGPRMGATLLSLYGVLILLLAALGIYGTIAYSLNRRRREMGIRMALGANAGGVIRMVLVEGLRIAAVGVVVGLAAATVAGRSLGSLLFGLRPSDPWTLGLAALTLLATVLLACFIPSLRVTRGNPFQVLRED